jgi:hypothetical protein
MLALARRVASAAALASIVVLVPASPAAASAGSVFLVGTASLPSFPCAPNCSGGTFASTVTAGVVGPPGSLVTDVTASFTYSESCTGGTADGIVTFTSTTGSESRSFHGDRYGTTIRVSGEVQGTLQFIPAPLPACGSSSAVHATVSGTLELVAL